MSRESVVAEVIRSNLGEGQCLLSDEQIASIAGVSARTVKRAIAAMVADGRLFSDRKGGKRKLSFVRSPLIDRGAKLEELVQRIRTFQEHSAEGLFFESRKKTAEALGISVPVLREVYELGERGGQLVRSTVERKGKSQEVWGVAEKEASAAPATEAAAPTTPSLFPDPAPVAANAPSSELIDLRIELERQKDMIRQLQAENQLLKSQIAVQSICVNEETEEEEHPTELEMLNFVLVKENAVLRELALKDASLEEFEEIRGEVCGLLPDNKHKSRWNDRFAEYYLKAKELAA